MRDRSELQELARDVHVSVTDFFRDPEAFDVLSARIIPQIFAQVSKERGDNRTIRIWVPGCATGEEAYSIAIALQEERQRRWHDSGIGIQIFATDVDAEGIRIAREAVYPEACMGNLGPQRREAFFDTLDTPGLYRVRQHIRDLVSFAQHNVLSDPPFSRLQLVSCRNLLIYLQRTAQEEAIATFHFSLAPQGFLFLGSSEALGGVASSFRVIHKKWRLYQRLQTQDKPGSRGIPLFVSRRMEQSGEESQSIRRQHQQRSGEVAALRLLAQTGAPPGVLINSQHQVLYLHGDLIEFLDLPSGSGHMTLIEMIRDEPRTRVRAAVYRASRQRETVETRGTITLRSGEVRQYTVTITPCESAELGDDLLMLLFVLDTQAKDADSDVNTMDTVNEELNREVEALRDDLQSTVEELEQTNEELRTSNEEAMTMNEELQSTNEELETQSEELRSVNEELITVNGQLREKLDELQEAHADIANLLNSTKLPAIFLDRDFCIRRYTPEARTLLSVIESDVGRPIHDLSGICIDDGMLEDAKNVIDGLAPVEKEIYDDEHDDWYLRRILPYRTSEDRIAGVVVTFSKVTRLKRLTAALTAEREQQQAIADIGMRAMREHDFTAVSKYAMEVAARTLDCPLCKVLELTPDRSRLKLIAGVGWKGGIVGQATVSNDNASQAGFTLQQAEAVIVEDLQTETRFQGPPLLTDHGVRSGISVIIHGPDNAPYGVLGVHSTKAQAFEEHTVAFVQQLANILSATLQRLAAEEALKTSERWFRALADNMSQLAWMGDESGAAVWYNRRWLEFTGATAETMEKHGWDSVQHPDHAERVGTAISESTEKGEEWEDTFPLRGGDGEYRWFLTRAMPIRDKHGAVTMWFGTATDITERREAEAELEANRRKLQAIIDNAPAAIYAKDLQGRFIMGNTAVLDALGVTLEQLIGKRDEDFVASKEQADQYRANDAKVVATGEACEFEEIVTVDGRDSAFISLKFPLRTGGDEIYAVCGISTNITQRKRDEQHLRVVMAELNHRVKNTIASIQALARITAGNTDSIEGFRDSFGDRLASMGVAHSLLTRSEWRGANIGDIVVSEVEPRVGSPDRLTLEGPTLSIRPKSALSLHMAIHELATNAAKYGALSTHDGRLAVTWKVASREGGDRVELSWLERGGPTLPRDRQEGFGSNMIRDMLAYELEGGVEFAFEPEGLHATIWFPLRHTDTGDAGVPAITPRRRARPARAIRKRAGSGSPARLMYVEDNSVIARYMSSHLTELGFAVLGPVSSVSGALAMLEEERPDVALLDIDLDGVQVYPVADVLKDMDIPFAFVTGYNEEDLPDSHADAPLFPKPLDLDALGAWLTSNGDSEHEGEA